MQPQQKDQPGPKQPDHLRLSDADRADALTRLSLAYGEGRLDIDEYDDRCEKVAKAATFKDLRPLFGDLPSISSVGAEVAPTSSREVEVYTRGELEKARASGKNMRLGLFGLGSLASMAVGITLASTVSDGWLMLPVFIIPTLFILLYIMKIGPDDWYAPSPQQLERQRLRELRAAQRIEAQQRRALRAEQRDQLTGDAMSIAQRAIERFKG